MPYTWNQIEADWLRGAQIGVLSATAVEAFNRAEAAFGRPWVEQHRNVGPVSGLPDVSATLEVTTRGAMLKAIDVVSNPDNLMEKLLANDASAWSELTALYLLANQDSTLSFDLEPRIEIARKVKHPDFAVRRGSDRLALVEVTLPDDSELTQHTTMIMQRITQTTAHLVGSYALEILLLREPDETEIESLIKLLPSVLTGRHGTGMALPNALGYVYLDDDVGGFIEVKDRGVTLGPVLGLAHSSIGPQARSHIVVRMQYTDARAKKVVKREAEQLSPECPGLIFIDTRNAPGAIRGWKPMVERILHPGQHTRVSAIALYSSGIASSDGGEVWQPELEVIRNENAKLPLPPEIIDSLAAYRRPSPLLAYGS